MKTCLLCGTPAPNEAETCVNDGEASWSPSDDAAVEDATVDAQTDKPARKRSAR